MLTKKATATRKAKVAFCNYKPRRTVCSVMPSYIQNKVIYFTCQYLFGVHIIKNREMPKAHLPAD